MLRCLLMTILTLAIFAAAHAKGHDDDEDGFQHGNTGQAPNQDSTQVPGLGMQPPQYSGSGCAQGTVSSVLTADHRELSILFDNYVVRAGKALGTRNAVANCRVSFNFSVPAGYQVQIVKIDYRGFENVPGGGRARFTAAFNYAEWNGHPMPLRRHSRKTDFKGPSQKDFQLSSLLRGPHFSPCGKPFALVADSSAQVTSNAAGDEAMLAIDSADTVFRPVKLSLRWQRCNGGGHGHGGGRIDDCRGRRC